jgi:hypothetical protein
MSNDEIIALIINQMDDLKKDLKTILREGCPLYKPELQRTNRLEKLIYGLYTIVIVSSLGFWLFK